MADTEQPGLLASVAGFGVTFRTMFTPVVTEEYPEQKVPTQPRFHGRHQLNRHPDGLEKCVGCELCAWACPADAILVEGANNDDTEGGAGRFSPGERYGRVYQINYLRCIFCGLCIEACPTRSLTMGNDFELADDNRQDLIYTKEQLMAPLLPGMEAPPHPMRLGDDEKDYYVEVELPGVRLEDVEVTTDEATVRIRGRRESSREMTRETVQRIERFFGPFERSFQFPSPVNGSKIHAKLDNGVLSLKIPKARARRRIPID